VEASIETKASKTWIIKSTVSRVKREVQCLLKIGIVAKDMYERQAPLMTAFDRLNGKCGRDTVRHQVSVIASQLEPCPCLTSTLNSSAF
jgi:hypothetical protein